MKACASRVCVLGVVLVWVRVLGRGLRSRWCRAPREDMILRLRLQEWSCRCFFRHWSIRNLRAKAFFRGVRMVIDSFFKVSAIHML